MSKNNSTRLQPLSLRSGKALGSARNALALGISASLMGSMAMAQEEETYELDTLQIEERTIDTNPYAEPGVPYKAKVSGDSRKVKPLAETPQTITVLTQTQIKDSGKSDLRDILAAQPGISLGTGENGNAFGDRYIIRGHEARSDVFVDGLRDPGMTIRESFAVEQVEITKGPSSTFAGRGSTGGAINSITKQASSEYNFNRVEAGVGTDDYRRITLDSNLPVNDDVAVRLNLLHAYEEVPDREPADRERNGVALSGALQATDRLDFKADVYYLEAEDKPDMGAYIDGNNRVVRNVPVYLQDEDFLESEVKTFTFQVGYEFANNVRLQNATRYGTTDNGYVTTGARGATGGGLSLSTHDGWQEVEYFANQTNLYWDTQLAEQKHQFVFSAEYSNHNVLNGRYLADPRSLTVDPSTVGDLGDAMNRQISKGDWDSDYGIDTWSLAVMDTIDFNERWSLFLGVRMDHFDYKNSYFASGDPAKLSYSDTLWNGHAGVVFNINQDANIYLTYSTSANINGGESDVGGSCGYGGVCGTGTKPEKTQNFELGTKWELLHDKLLLTAAIFRITKDDVMESVGDRYSSDGSLNSGKNRVEGVEVSLVGNITDELSAQFGAALMNAKVLESFNDGVNLTTNRQGETVPSTDMIGNTLANFADKSLFLQLRYQLTDAFGFGAIATYSSEAFLGQPDAGSNEARSVPSYTVYDVFADYRFNKDLSVRLNVGNVTDEDFYLAGYQSGAFAYIGDRRNAQLTVAYDF